MKSLTVLLLLCGPFFAVAQGAFSNQTHTALQQVIADYPNNFRNIRGPLVSEDEQTVNFTSTVQIPGATQAFITKYNSEHELKESYSWRCEMAASEEFDDIAKRYRELYNQIRNSIVKIDGEKPFILNGAYETPTEEKRFIASSFALLPSTGAVGKVKVELALEYLLMEWRVTLLVYNSEEESLVLGRN